MIQQKKFMNPVYKRDGTNRVIEAADTVDFLLDTGAVQTETVTAVGDGGRWISWESSTNGTRKEDVRAVESVHHKDCAQYA